MRNPILLALLWSLLYIPVMAQDPPAPDRILSFPDKLFGAVDKKARSVAEKLDKQTDNYLRKLARREEKLKRKLWKKDSTLAKQLFGNVNERYAKLRASANNTEAHYSPHLDSLNTALRFIDENNSVQDPAVNKTLSSLKEVQAQLNATDHIKKELAARQAILKEQLQKFGMTKELDAFKKEVYYYRQQVKEYKELWEDPSRLEAKLMQQVQKLPLFKKFFARHSQLAALFSLPQDNSSVLGNLAGLQTRASVQQGIVDRFGSGPDVTQMIRQQVQSAQGQLNSLKTKAEQYASGSFGSKEDLDMPEGFKPNSQKTKSFLQRLEIGANIQTQKARFYFPATTDIALSAGYRFNNNAVMGIGVAYKAGLGTGWDRIALSHQGIGLRSYIDHKIKGSFYLTGGYEQNYLSQFNRVAQLQDLSAWQASGLVGLTKKYKVAKKLKGEMKLLWDFLSYQQVPRTQALLFRVGYSLK